MKREYAVNYNEPEWRCEGNGYPELWMDKDYADWHKTWDEAFRLANEKIAEEQITIVKITTFIDGEADSHYEIREEDGGIHHYDTNGNRLWLDV